MKNQKKSKSSIGKRYQTPKLVSYGNIREITQNTNKQNPANDGASNPGQNKTSIG